MILAAGSIFDPVYNFFGAILAFFYSLFPNPDYGLGVAIILLTFLVMLVTFPLTAKQAKSMLSMQRAQPEIKKLQAKYKNDRAKLNEEMMKYYQENKINPLAGCLPLLIQMPIFLALFRVMRDPYKHIPKSSELYAAFCTPTSGPKAGEVQKVACNVPKLGLPNPLYFLNLNLSLSATQAKGALIDTLPYFILVGLVILTGFLQARQSRRNAPNMNAQMAMVTSILPIGFGLFSLGFPSGLVLYFFISNTWRLGQQEVIMRKITRPGQAAMKAAQAGTIDVEGAERGTTKTVPDDKPPAAGGGLRKLFQLPAASSDSGANGGAKPTGAKSTGAKSTGAKSGSGPKPTGRTAPKPAAKSGGTGASASGGASSAARRRNNKKRKKR
jgi:YidC/Oxa1 family membrane protein insertase